MSTRVSWKCTSAFPLEHSFQKTESLSTCLIDHPLAQVIQQRPPDAYSGSNHSLSIAKSFLTRCRDQHETCKLLGSEALLPSRVLDVGSPDGLIKLIEPMAQYGVYICLSYCVRVFISPLLLIVLFEAIVLYSSNCLTSGEILKSLRQRDKHWVQDYPDSTYMISQQLLEMLWKLRVTWECGFSGLIACVSAKMTAKTGRENRLAWPTYTPMPI